MMSSERVSRKIAVVNIVAATSATVLIAAFLISIHIPLDTARLSPESVTSLQIFDRNGILLREVLSDQEGRSRWVTLDRISPHLVNAFVAAEDRRFFRHNGFDAIAFVRAIWINLKSMSIKSGGSTITQQLVRMVYPLPKNDFLRKPMEIWLAMRLENTISKREILEQYLNRVPCSNQIFGVEAASQTYFDKPAFYLGVLEAATIAAIPKATTFYNPYMRPEAVARRRDIILRRMCENGFIDRDELNRLVSKPLSVAPRINKFKAPHFVDYIISRISNRRDITRVKTTIDLHLQEAIEKLVKQKIDELSDQSVTNAAVLVLDNHTGDILAMVGSADYFDPDHAGQVNGVLAPRQPGSTLKPFTYALALESGMTTASIIPDVPSPGEPFIALNYDGEYHGPVRLREALANSYNVPAVKTLRKVGVKNLLSRLHRLGFHSLDKPASHYGLALTLGAGEVTLLELVRGYTALARCGLPVKERAIIEPEVAPNPPSEEVFAWETCYLITDVLSDNDARIPAFGANNPLELPFPCAVKTGTSKDFRDNWTVGYTPDYTVGVWVGNFDGKPMRKVSGVTGAGPLFHDVMILVVGEEKSETFSRPPGIVESKICPLSGKLVGPNCPGMMVELFVRGTEPKTICDMHRRLKDNRGVERVVEVYPPEYTSWLAERQPGYLPPRDSIKPSALKIIFPQNGNEFRIDAGVAEEYQKIALKAAVSEDIDRITWLVDGERIGEVEYPFTFFWQLRPGRHLVSAIGGCNCARDEVIITVH